MEVAGVRADVAGIGVDDHVGVLVGGKRGVGERNERGVVGRWGWSRCGSEEQGSCTGT